MSDMKVEASKEREIANTIYVAWSSMREAQNEPDAITRIDKLRNGIHFAKEAIDLIDAQEMEAGNA